MIQRLLAPLTLLAALSFAAAPFVVGGFGGFTPAQFPVVVERWPVQPVGWAFSIWGGIYLWLVIGSGWGLWRARNDAQWQAMRGPLAVSLALGTAWIPVAQRQPVAATVMLIFMAATALAAFLRAPRGVFGAGPVGLYAGWVTAACGIALGISLGGQGVLSGQAAALVCLGAVILAGLCVQWLRPDVPSYGFGVAWALMGVIIANAPEGNLHLLALCGTGLVALGAMVWRRRARQTA